MNCRECVDRLEQLVDRELSPLEAAEVQMHLENCPDCTDRFQFEEPLFAEDDHRGPGLVILRSLEKVDRVHGSVVSCLVVQVSRLHVWCRPDA